MLTGCLVNIENYLEKPVVARRATWWRGPLPHSLVPLAARFASP